ncbi:MAG: serine hydrolase domain-containing protein [Candidatus Cybelea sp.]|jgi:D-alanyl-D-alanine carboxypeptidase
MLAAAFFAPQLTIAAKSLFEREGGPGGAIGVVQNGNLIYVETLGVRSLASKQPVDDQTRFEIGSVTKMFTAAAVLQLKERGKLSIDDPLSKYVPSFPHASEVTIRQLLTHTSGLPEYDTMDDFVDRMASIPNALPDIEAFARGPLGFRPGTKWEYSNTNYIALGLVIAAVSGECTTRSLLRSAFRNCLPRPISATVVLLKEAR